MIKKDLLDKLSTNTLIRYVAIGGTTYFIELIFLYVILFFSEDRIIAVGISFWVGLIISFVLQKFLAFKNHEKKPKMLAKQTLLYSILVVVNYAFTLMVVASVSPITGLFISRTAALLITTGWNYLVYKKIIFITNPN